ncbi:TetR/AcrR family transcriptional regulator [Shimia sp. SDUM112013]|uniref:TetR/AcrR family transcriptional regulator n=1 Tax=Shimia sp. SDUM112013 TaxID=3136160 RepID=UPI0032EEB619
MAIPRFGFGFSFSSYSKTVSTKKLNATNFFSGLTCREIGLMGERQQNAKEFSVGLRERQKQERQEKIVEVAKELYLKQGFEGTTIEAIAEAAGVSGVTVHKYYGTKAGILLALIAQSDAQLIARLTNELAQEMGDLIEVTAKFAAIIVDHAMQNLEKEIWRQVISAVTLNAGSPLSKTYFELDQELAQVLVRKIEAMQEGGALPDMVNARDLGKALFHLQNARFIQFISSDDLTSADIDHRLRRDLRALLSFYPATS